MTESELLAEIQLVSTAISNVLKTGKRYEIGTGASRRIFEFTELGSLRNYRKELQREYDELYSDYGIGSMLGF